MKKTKLIIAISALCSTYVLWASSPEIRTFRDCVNYARDNNISLQKIELNQQITNAELQSEKAQWLPSVDFAMSHGFTNLPFCQSLKNTYNSSYGFNANWTIWNGGQRENSIKKSEISKHKSRILTEDAFRTIETDILQAYLNILYARESISIYEEAVKLSEAQADRALKLWEAGRISKVDYAQLKSQLEQDRYSLSNASGVYESRRIELKKLLDLGINGNVSPVDISWSTDQLLSPLPPLDESYALAVENDMTLRSLNMDKQSSELDIEIAKGSRLPTIALNAGVTTGYSAPGSSFGESLKRSLNEFAGLTFSVPISDQKKSRTAVINARIATIDTELDIQNRLTQLAQSVENWYIDTQSSQSRYKAAVEQLDAASLTNELTSEQFNLGLVNIVELMSAHKSLIEAQHSLLQAKYMVILGQKMIEYYRTTEINL